MKVWVFSFILFFHIISCLHSDPPNAIEQLPDSLLEIISNADEKESIALINQYCYQNRGRFYHNFGISLMLNNYNRAKKISYIDGQAFALGNFLFFNYKKCNSTGMESRIQWIDYLNYVDVLDDKTTDTLSKFVLYEGAGHLHHAVGEIGKSFNYYFKSIFLAEKLKEFEKIMIIYRNICFSYEFVKNYDMAIKYAKKGLEVARNNNLNINQVVRFAVNSYLKSGQEKELLPLLLASLNELKEINSLRGQVDFCAWIAKCYWHLGLKDSTDIYTKRAFELLTLFRNTGNTARSLLYFADIYLDEADYPMAYKCINKAHHIYEVTKPEPFKIISFTYFGRYYLKINDYDKAISYLKKALDIAYKVNSENNINYINKILADYYYKIKNYKLAYEHYLQHTKGKDSLDKIFDKKRADLYEVTFDFEKKEKENEYLKAINKNLEFNQQRTHLYFFIAILILFIIIGVLIFLRKRHIYKEKQEKLLNEQRQQKLEIEALENEKAKNEAEIKAIDAKLHALRLQLNPHFIFNSANSIQYLIMNNRNKEASEYIKSFATLMRFVLENSGKNSIALDEEIDFLRHYLQLEKLRLKDKFEYEINIDKNLNPEETYIPPMLLQPFVENSIVHGIMNKKEKGIIKIGVVKSNGIIQFTIQDNGIGRQNAIKNQAENNSGKNGKAITITNERINLLEKIWSKPIKLNIVDLLDNEKNPSGTKVEIEIS